MTIKTDDDQHEPHKDKTLAHIVAETVVAATEGNEKDANNDKTQDAGGDKEKKDDITKDDKKD